MSTEHVLIVLLFSLNTSVTLKAVLLLLFSKTMAAYLPCQIQLCI